MDLRNANIIVTGGAKGMGRHFAEAAAKAGAKVFVGDVDEKWPRRASRSNRTRPP